MRKQSLCSQSLGVFAVAMALNIPQLARAEVTFTDSSGLRYTVNTDITFSTSSSASGAASEASYESPVQASTVSGGTAPQTLSDMFDGYAALAISFEAAVPTEQPQTGDATIHIYNNNGPSTLDGACDDRQTILNTQDITGAAGTLEVHRRVFVPANDTFIRWLNVLHNPGEDPITVHVGFANNLGSDSNTQVITSSDDDDVAELTDTWVTSMQAFSGTTSSDPRIGHVLQSEGAVRAPLVALDFVNGDDNPFWWYTVTVEPGESATLAMFATGQPTRALAASKAAELASLANAHMFDCMSLSEVAAVVNMQVQCTEPGDEGQSCDDNDLCTEDDVCTAGQCVGTAKACRSSASDCTGVCDPLTGLCAEDDVPDTTACDNGDACDGVDTCQSGVCTAGTALDCNDRNPCTTDSCATATGCVNAMMSGCMACGTGEDAGADDDGGAPAFPACDDDNVCNGSESCGADDTCQAGTALDCDDGDPCTADSCDAEDGCAHETIASCMACDDDGDCDDGNVCDGAETCDDGLCVASEEELDCDDDDACTTDSCVPASGCAHDAITTGACAPSPTDGGMPMGGSSGMGAGGSSGTGAGGSSGTSAGEGGSDADAGGGSSGDSGGCDCSTLGSGSASTAGLWALALALIGLRRRRRG